MLKARQFTGSPLYQNSHATPEEIKAGFAVRLSEYEVIMQDLHQHWGRKAVQHYLLLGRKGSGKSTLLRRIQVEIDTNKDLDGYVAINLAEEQANIYRISDLLEEMVRELEYRKLPIEWPQPGNDDYEYAKELFKVIHWALEKGNKKLVLLLDNLDRIFDNLDEDLSLLRAHLQTYGDIKIIGGSTRLTEHFLSYGKPFYEYFRVMRLQSLSSEEVKKLLLNWAEKQQLPQLKELVEHKPGRIEAIRNLTDGLPRTIQIFVQILITKNPDSGYEYLWGLMDEATGSYQERLNFLPPAQRKIILQLAFFWEAVGAREIAQATRMETKLISAQLNQLVEKKVVDKIETDNKNHLYRLSERFFNLWLIITQGNADARRKAKYLTIFLENFYDETELLEFASAHLEEIKIGQISPGKAVLLTKAFAQSKFINSGTRDELIRKTLSMPGIDEEMKKEIPPTTLEVYGRVEKFMAGKNWQRAFQEVDTIEQQDGTRDFIMGIIYKAMGDVENEERYYLRAGEFGLRNALHDLLVLYLQQGRFEALENLFWKAYQHRLPMEPESLLDFRRTFADPDIKWEGGGYPFQYELHLGETAVHLGAEYDKQGNFEQTEKYFRLAIELGNEHGLYNLGVYYCRENKNKEEALQLLDEYFEIDRSPGKIQRSFYVTLKVWAGDLEDIDRLIRQVIEGEEYVYPMLESLLIHHQTALSKQLFSDDEMGRLLKEKYLPFYYSLLLLTDGGSRIKRKIPPELRETVDSILKEVEERRKFYY